MASAKTLYLATPADHHCVSSNVHEGQSRGQVEVIEGAPTYISKPSQLPGNGNIIFYFPDVHGFYNNSLLLMDAFAEAGYTVFGIDYFRDDPIWKHQKDKDDKTTDPGFDRNAWREKHSAFAKSTSPKWTKAIAERFGNEKTKYAAVGYCFGAPYVIDAVSVGGIASVAATAHPTALTEDHFRGLEKPLFLSCAEHDPMFPAEKRHRAEEILKEDGKRYHIQLFQGVNHGFAVRCNPNDAYERFVKEQSYKSIVDWFNFWLAQDE